MIFDSLPPWIVNRGDQAVPTSSSQPEDIGRAPQAWTRLGTVRLTIKARPRSYTAAMPTARDPLYQRHRFPPEVISHAVWLYFRFPLSLRMVEEMLAARGICVTYETVRQWGKKFGKAFADQIRQRAPARGDKWHMDGVSRTHF